MIYSSLIEPYLRYCNIVWGQCNETLKDKLQALQNKADRSIAKVKYEDADHHKLLGQFGRLSVRNLIRLDMGIFMYNCQSGFMPDSITGLYMTVDNIHSYHTRSMDMGTYIFPGLYTALHKALYHTLLWNEIPIKIRKAQSVETFKEKLREHCSEIQNENRIIFSYWNTGQYQSHFLHLYDGLFE